MESNRAFSFPEMGLIGLIGLMRRIVTLFPCLLVSLSPCLLVSLSPHLSVMAQNPAAGAKSDFSAAQLIEQGKALYRAQRLKPALAKFEAALKLEPKNDEALSLAAVTAFRLDLQPQSRDYFIRRANLTGQRDSVKAFRSEERRVGKECRSRWS